MGKLDDSIIFIILFLCIVVIPCLFSIKGQLEDKETAKQLCNSTLYETNSISLYYCNNHPIKCLDHKCFYVTAYEEYCGKSCNEFIILS